MDVFLTAQQLKRLAEWTQYQLFGASVLTSGNSDFPTALSNDPHLRIVFITLSDNQGQHVVAHAMALGIKQTVAQALEKARSLACKIDVKSAKLDVVERTVSVDAAKLKANKKVIPDPSLYGIAFGQFKQAWLPEQNLRYRLVRKDLGLDYKVLKSTFAVNKPDALWYFTTQAYYLTANNTLALYRGHQCDIDITPSVAQQRALAGAHYLSRAVRKDGSFVYTYQSGLNKEADDYNIVRHAGTIWAMLELLKDESDPEERALTLAAAERAVNYLLACIKPYPWAKQGGDAQVVVENDKAKVGGNGLAVVALVEYYRLAPSEDLLTLIRGLAHWLVDNQSNEGEFYAHKVDVTSGDVMDFTSDYYPGEAILGLMRLYSVDADKKWQQAAVNAARWLINVRDAGKTLEDLEHDHWLMYGINEVYRAQPEPLLLEHMRKLIRAILSKQHMDIEQCKRPDWLGGWYKPPRTTPAACRVEGLMAAAALLEDAGDNGEVHELMRAAKAGLRFQLQNQLWNEKLMYLPNPHRARGGFHSNLTNWHIRIDYVQHTIVALSAWARRAK